MTAFFQRKMETMFSSRNNCSILQKKKRFATFSFSPPAKKVEGVRWTALRGREVSLNFCRRQKSALHLSTSQPVLQSTVLNRQGTEEKKDDHRFLFKNFFRRAHRHRARGRRDGRGGACLRDFRREIRSRERARASNFSCIRGKNRPADFRKEFLRRVR